MKSSGVSDQETTKPIGERHCVTPVRPKTLNVVEGPEGGDADMGSEVEDADEAEREHEKKCEEAIAGEQDVEVREKTKPDNVETEGTWMEVHEEEGRVPKAFHNPRPPTNK